MAEYKSEQLQDALWLQARHQKQSKPLDLQQRRDYRGGAVLWSPRKIREANTRLAIKERDKEQEKVAIAQRKVNRATTKLKKEQQLAQRKADREKAKRDREKEKAAKAERATKAREEKQREKEAATSQKSYQQADMPKRKASHQALSKSAKRCRVVASRSGEGPASPVSWASALKLRLRLSKRLQRQSYGLKYRPRKITLSFVVLCSAFLAHGWRMWSYARLGEPAHYTQQHHHHPSRPKVAA